MEHAECSTRPIAKLVATTFTVAALVAGLAPPAYGLATVQAIAPASSYPLDPPARICGDTALLSGPSAAPAGAVTVPAGDNLDFFVNEGYKGAGANGTTYYFAPGVHTLGLHPYAQIRPADNTTFIGAPGAILDGQHANYYAFTGWAKGVTIKYLTIQGFSPGQDQGAINHNGGENWTFEYNTMRDIAAVGLNVSTGSVARYNCITNNHQTGINGVGGTHNVTIDHNEIGNNATDPKRLYQICGCIGGIKLFDVKDSKITNNWVHDNAAPAVWGDTNAVGFLIEGNYINDNTHEAILFETSYNALIRNNNLVRNAIWKGELFTSWNDSFPIGAIYISESGGDERAYGGKYSTLEVSGNNLDNNYGGVTLFEDTNRFCNTPGNNSPGFCPLVGEATPETCVEGTIDSEPYFTDCRWRTKNVLVQNNTFRIDKEELGCSGTRCGENSIFSWPGDRPSWSPYLGNVTRDAITFQQNNRFVNNTYIGDWHFDVYQQGNKVNWDTWRSAPYKQDAGSTLSPLPHPPPGQPQSLWRDTHKPAETKNLPFTLGTRFQVATQGVVEALRFYQTPNMSGSISLKLWRATSASTAVELASVVHNAAVGEPGWKNATLVAPVALDPAERYVVSYHAVNSFFPFKAHDFQTPRVTGDLTANAPNDPVGYGNSLYLQEYGTHNFPNVDSGGHSYFADVVFKSTTGTPAPPLSAPAAATESLWADGQAVTEADLGYHYTLGTRFQVAVTGTVPALRFYETQNMSGTVGVKLWRSTGPTTAVELASASFDAAGPGAGWRNVTLASPVDVVPTERYVVTYHTTNAFVYALNYFSTSHTAGNLKANATGDPVGYDNGLFQEEYGSHTFPVRNSGGTSYFADVVFDRA